MFTHDLALGLGMTTGELSKRMTNAEFERWKKYYNKKPFGTEREGYNIAVLCSLIANIHRGKGKAAFKPSDFMYKDAGEIKKTNIQQTMAALNSRAKKNGRKKTG